jgi:hypothetical protein
MTTSHGQGVVILLLLELVIDLPLRA